jgi:hypothetical protein
MTRPVVTLVAGGWSASCVDLERLPGLIIGVNDAAVRLSRFDYCVSMDRLWAENRIDWIEEQRHARIWLRASTVGNIRERVARCPHVELFQNSHTATSLAVETSRLDGTHSGFCALNLAYHLRPQILYLVGFDMQLGPRGERHWFPDYPWNGGGGSKAGKLSEWAAQFAKPAEQLSRITRVYRVAAHGSPLLSPLWVQITPEQLAQRAKTEALK